MQKRALIYARVSSDEQRYNFSLNNQMDSCRQDATQNGDQVNYEYREDYTGTTLDRPEFNKVRDLAERKAIDLVIVHDIDRLARGLMLQLIAEHELRLCSVEVRYVHGGSFDDTPEGQLQKNILGSFSEYERMKILRRMADGKRRRATEGHFLPSRYAPYGYRYVSEPHGGHLEIVDAEAVIVRQIYTWYTVGDETGRRLNIRSITRRLSQEHVPTRVDALDGSNKLKAVGVWNMSVITKILADEMYAGTFWWGRTKQTGHGQQYVYRPREQWIAIPVPAIVDRETFDAARRMASDNKMMAKRNVQHDYLLRGRLLCERCGHRMQAHAQSQPERIGPYYYRCRGTDSIYSRDSMTPTCHWSLHADDVDARCWGKLKTLLLAPDGLADDIRRQQAAARDKSTEYESRLAEIARALADLDRQQETLLDARLTGGLPKADYNKRQGTLNERRGALEWEQNDIGRRLRSAQIADEDIDAIQRDLADLAIGIEHATFEQQLQTLDTLDMRGVVVRGERKGQDRIHLVGNFHGAVIDLWVDLRSL